MIEAKAVTVNNQAVVMGDVKIMTAKEIEALVDVEERRLGVGSREFRQRHEEIMEEMEAIERRKHDAT